jgi:hypothetical protein
MNNTNSKIHAIAAEILARPVPQRDAEGRSQLPAHVWAGQLRDELAHARAALAQIKGIIANLDDDGVIAQADDTYEIPQQGDYRCAMCGSKTTAMAEQCPHCRTKFAMPSATKPVTCEGCHAIVSSDLTERGLCQRCRS